MFNKVQVEARRNWYDVAMAAATGENRKRMSFYPVKVEAMIEVGWEIAMHRKVAAMEHTGALRDGYVFRSGGIWRRVKELQQPVGRLQSGKVARYQSATMGGERGVLE